MSITDELREWAARELASWKMAQERFDALTDIADRIDEAVASEYVRLPEDADGEPIHIGDKIDVYQTKNVEVVGVGDKVVFTHYYMGDYSKHFAADCRHHHEPTVEDVLDEFASAYDRIGGEDEEHQKYLNLIAEYTKRIREVVRDE